MSDLAGIGQGAHLCVYYDTDEARASLVARYLAIGFESMMNQFYPTSRAVGMCLYDCRLLPGPVLEKALHTHSIVGVNEKLFANSGFDRANRT